MMRKLFIATLLFVAACSETGGGSPPGDGEDDAASGAVVLRLNQIQLEATHNSYHVETPGTTIPDWQYSEAPLDVQLEQQGVRGFELDTHFDVTTSELIVHHIAGLDAGTTCERFRDCLQLLKTWSDAHPGHHTLFLHIEPKDAELGETPDFAVYAAALDATLEQVWTRARLVTPADVQGDAETLREGVLARGWPGVEATRGKLLAYLDERGPFHEAYTRGGTDLTGRLAFPSSHVEEPIAAVVISNDPTDPATRAAVDAGFIVRTRADGVPVTADLQARRTEALESGAQIVSTDFPVGVDGVASAFEIPQGMPSRCNPVTATKGCVAQDVEDPATLTQ